MVLDETGVRRSAGAPEVRLAPGATATVVAAHERAANLLRRPAAAGPATVDAGDAAELVHRLLVGLAAAGDDLADVHALLAALVRGVERRLADTDGTVAEVLLELRSAA